MKKLIFAFLLMLSLSALGQKEKYKITATDYDNDQVEMADVMRQNGKIYVVVGVIMIIFAVKPIEIEYNSSKNDHYHSKFRDEKITYSRHHSNRRCYYGHHFYSR